MKRVIEEIENYMDTKEIILSLLFTIILLFVSFVGYSRLALIPITVRTFTTNVYVTHYGFPFGMMEIFTPVTNLQNQIVTEYTLMEGGTRFQILWAGLFLDFVTYFSLTFFVIYLFQKYILS